MRVAGVDAESVERVNRSGLKPLLQVTLAAALCACGGSGADGVSSPQAGNEPPPVSIDRSCDAAPFPSAQWTICETQNYEKVLEAPAEQARNPGFLLRWQTQGADNHNEWLARAIADPSWLLLPSGNSTVTPLCATWGMQCAGDPFRYRAAPGPDGASFYDFEAEVVPFVIYDDGCARISGRVWAPKGAKAGDALPNVVIENGSVQAPEPPYWWAAQMLVRAGYVVLTFDPRGQGRSDQQTPSGTQGSNANSSVFWTGLVNVIDFFRSTPDVVYPHNQTCAGTYPTEVVDFNPFWDRIDRDRLGIVGHSLGAQGVSVVQSYGAPDAEPWPGLIDADNPVKVTVGWDSVSSSVIPHTPTMNQSSEYGLTPAPFLQPPDPEAKKKAFANWVAAGIPMYTITVRGSSHYEWSLLPSFPTTSWCPDTIDGYCDGGWGNALAQWYTLAWLDRWLKAPGEPGYDDADDRLLDDGGAQGIDKFSFRYKSARSFPDRAGVQHVCEDIRAGC